MGAVYAVQAEVAPGSEAEWERWYTEHHVPEVLAEPGFLRARKLRSVEPAGDGWTRYLVLYELESQEAIDAYLAGSAVARLRQDHKDRFGGVTRLSRLVLTDAGVVEAARAR